MKMFMWLALCAIIGWFIVPIVVFLFWAAVVLFVLNFLIQVFVTLWVLSAISKENNDA
jgi:hypothetical protein